MPKIPILNDTSIFTHFLYSIMFVQQSQNNIINTNTTVTENKLKTFSVLFIFDLGINCFLCLDIRSGPFVTVIVLIILRFKNFNFVLKLCKILTNPKSNLQKEVYSKKLSFYPLFSPLYLLYLL